MPKREQPKTRRIRCWKKSGAATNTPSSKNRQPIYQAIRTLLKDKEAYPVQEFYRLIDTAFAEETHPGYAENAAAHVWGYFKKHATDAERRQYEKNLANYRNGTPAR